jgi:hypothetical protein
MVSIPHKVQAHLPAILPSFQAYVHSSSQSSFGEELTGSRGATGGAVTETPATAVIHRILAFLGKVGGLNRHLLGGAVSQRLA